MTEPHEALFLLGTRQMAEGDLLGAEASFREALRIRPQLFEAHTNLGLLLERRSDAAAAEQCYRRALQLNPGNAQTHLNLGVLLASQKRFGEAEQAYKQALELDASALAAWSNLGALYACMQREREAEHCYRTVLAVDPSPAQTQLNLSYLLLGQGRVEDGWSRFEARDWPAYRVFAAHFACPRWRGEPLGGKSIAIAFDAGFGDTIQFARYLSALRARGASRVALICQPALKRLFASLAGVDRLYAFDEDVPKSAWDFWAPIMSLPFCLQTWLDLIPAQLPYLRAEPEKVATWAERLSPACVRVGLCWQGNPRFENDRDRSLPGLASLAPLADMVDVSFVSLQKGLSEPARGLPIFDAAPQLHDFSDTAAAIANLDLVISVDSAVAHLTGALAKPIWILLPRYRTDWRWLSERDDSPWYPEVMRLFRQEIAGDWTETIGRVRAALAQFVGVCKTQSGRAGAHDFRSR